MRSRRPACLTAPKSRVPRGPEGKAVTGQSALVMRHPPATGSTGRPVACMRNLRSCSSRGTGLACPTGPSGLASSFKPRLAASTAAAATATAAALAEDFTADAEDGPGERRERDDRLDQRPAHVAVQELEHA